ncbi:MAG TPA: fibronectin type III domain-containing protein [Xanthomonadaceae bacterium]|nr:fibronectin type III domain-containing protein [Xanthomonadaceae bacterium]
MNLETSNPTLPATDATTAGSRPQSESSSHTPSAATGGQKTAKVAIGFVNTDNDGDLAAAVSRILAAMTGNAHFPDPAPALATVAAARDALLAQVNVAEATRVTLARRRQLRPPLVALVRQLAQYVQATGNGDRVVLTASGFPLQRSPQPIGVLPAPENLRLSRGAVSGQLRARCKNVAKASAYQWRIAAVQTPGVWLPADPTVAARTTLAGLTPGTAYLVQVRAIGTRGPSDWSDAVTQIAM